MNMEDEEDNIAYVDHDDIDEDIKLLKTVLQDDDNDEDFESDGELQVLEQNDDEHVSHASLSRPSTSTDYTVSSFPTTSMGTDADDLYKIDNSSINPETCLAMNRAYQEVLLDTLRQIEMSLAENRLKQRELSESLDEKSKKPTKETSSTRHKFVLNTPFFTDGDEVPPFNSDVQQKVSMHEEKIQYKPRLGWSKKSKKKLLNAVRNDALEQEIRPILNKLELESSKLMECKNDEEIKATKAKIEELREEVKQKQKIPGDELLKRVNTDKIDFLKISALTFDGKYTVSDCESMWKNVLHPSINRYKWSLAEDEKLVELVKKNNLKNWETIAKDLGTNRTPFQCFQHYQLNSIVYDTSDWKPEEDELLREVVETCKYGYGRIHWSQVAFYVDMRSASQCRTRWGKINPEAKHGRWSNKEDCLLMSAVDRYGVTDWARISQIVPGRSGIQCRDRYLNSILVANNPWSYDEDKKFLKLYEQHKNFATVALYMPKRTEASLSMRYEKLKQWESEWNNFCALPRPVQEEKLCLKFRLSENGEIVSAKCLATWTKQELERRKDHNSIAKEQKAFRKYFSKPELMRNWEESEWNNYATQNQICEEDYCRQEEDRMTGDIIIPRPPPVKVDGPENKYRKARSRLGRLIEGQVEKVCSRMETGQSTETTNSLRGELEAAIQPLLNREERKKFVEEKVDDIIKQYWFKGNTSMSVRNILRVIRGDLNTKFAENANASREMKRSARLLKCKAQKEIWAENESESESEKSEEDEETDDEEEEEDKIENARPRKFQGPITQKEFIRRQFFREKMGERKIASELLREAIYAKLPMAEQPGRKKNITMYPNSVLQKIKLMSPAETEKQQHKCIALLMKSFDVNADKVYKNAIEAKRKHAARALLNMTGSLGRTRLSTGAKMRAVSSNEVIETADLALAVKGETEPQNDTEEDTENEDTSNKTADQTPSTVKIEPDSDAATSRLYEEYDKCLPYIPPNFSNMAAMKTLLLEHRRMVDNAGYYFDKQELRNKLYSLKEKGPNLFMNVMGSVGTLKGLQKKMKQFKKETEAENQIPFVDVIKHVRKTKSYQQLRARFQAAFCWPALMAIVPPPNPRAKPPEHISKLRETMEEEKEEQKIQAAETAAEVKKAKERLQTAEKSIRTMMEQAAMISSGQTATGIEAGTSNANLPSSTVTSIEFAPDEEQKDVSLQCDQGTSCQIETNEGDGDQTSLDDCIKQVILMCGEEYVDSGIEEEAINKLLDRIMNIYREKREIKSQRMVGGKYRKRKKMSPSMSAVIDNRERMKILKRLHLYDKYMQIQKDKREKEGKKDEKPEEIPPEENIGPRRRGRPKGAKNNCNTVTDENPRKSARQELLRAKAQQLEVYEECGASAMKIPRQDLRQFQRGPDDPYIYDIKAMKVTVTDKKSQPPFETRIKPEHLVETHRSIGTGTIDFDTPVRKKQKPRVVKPTTVSNKKKMTKANKAPEVINAENVVAAESENPLIVIEFDSQTKRKLNTTDVAEQGNSKVKRQKTSNTKSCEVNLAVNSNKSLIQENFVIEITNPNNSNGIKITNDSNEITNPNNSSDITKPKNSNVSRFIQNTERDADVLPDIVEDKRKEIAGAETFLNITENYEISDHPDLTQIEASSNNMNGFPCNSQIGNGDQVRETVPFSFSQPAVTNTVPMSNLRPASPETLPMLTLQPADIETAPNLTSPPPRSTSQPACTTSLPLSTLPACTFQPFLTETAPNTVRNSLSNSQQGSSETLPISTLQPADAETAPNLPSLPAYSNSQAAINETLPVSSTTSLPASSETIPVSTLQPFSTETAPSSTSLPVNSTSQSTSTEAIPMSTSQPPTKESFHMSSIIPSSIKIHPSSTSTPVCSLELPLEPQNVSSAIEAEEQAVSKNLLKSTKSSKDADKSDGDLDLKNIEPVVIGVPVMIGGTQQTAWLPVYPGKDGKLLRDKDGKIIIPNAMLELKKSEGHQSGT